MRSGALNGGRCIYKKGNLPKFAKIAATAVLTKARNGRPSILGIRACAATTSASPCEACQEEVRARQAAQPLQGMRCCCTTPTSASPCEACQKEV